jgi:hypothetical protein
MLGDYILNRLREPSTWRGAFAMLTALGVVLRPDQQEAVISIGLAVVGALGVFLPDAKRD